MPLSIRKLLFYSVYFLSLLFSVLKNRFARDSKEIRAVQLTLNSLKNIGTKFFGPYIYK
jgi:hypothetical protein